MGGAEARPQRLLNGNGRKEIYEKSSRRQKDRCPSKALRTSSGGRIEENDRAKSAREKSVACLG